jgi:SAM-dependent methyltransferase
MITRAQPAGGIDLVAGDLVAPPVAAQAYDVTVALNTIDMLPEPAVLPEIQARLLKPGGIAIQSSPYIWHESVAAELRHALPSEIRDSAKAAEWLYARAGLQVTERVEHLPWLFFKHARQLEIYSVHAFQARKGR